MILDELWFDQPGGQLALEPVGGLADDARSAPIVLTALGGHAGTDRRRYCTDAGMDDMTGGDG
jgi:hypothetical protein